MTDIDCPHGGYDSAEGGCPACEDIVAAARSCPDRAWLQIEDDGEAIPPGEGRSWCNRKINASDVEYVRAPIAAAPAPAEATRQPCDHRGWIGVDFDGTLAHYDGFRGLDHLGEPVPAMLERVKAWIAEGRDVRLFTARGCRGGDEELLAYAHLRGWCQRHLGRWLPITRTKDMHMHELWDDRAVQVVKNTGRRVDEATPAPTGEADKTIARLREIARPLGWAITTHGSMERDLDVVAVPWTAEAIDGRVLVDALCSGIGYLLGSGNPSDRPHGRLSCFLVAPDAVSEQQRINRGEIAGPAHPKGRWWPPAIDVSVMPLAAPPARPVVTIPQELIDEARALLTHSTGGQRTFDFLERVAALAAAQGTT